MASASVVVVRVNDTESPGRSSSATSWNGVATAAVRSGSPSAAASVAAGSPGAAVATGGSTASGTLSTPAGARAIVVPRVARRWPRTADRPGTDRRLTTAPRRRSSPRGRLLCSPVSSPARSRAVGEERGRPLDQRPLVGVGEPGAELVEGHPGDLGHLDVGVGQGSPDGAQQEVVHRLVHPAAVGDEPEVDDAERGDDLADDPGLLRHLPDGGVLGGLPLLDVALGQRPQQPAAPVGAPDEGGTGFGHPVVGDHQAPGRGLVDPAQPAAGASSPARPSHARRVARPAALPWLVVSATPPSRPGDEPVPPAVQQAVRELVDVSPVLTELGERFAAAGFEAHLVGGSVRDALLAAGSGRPRTPGDLDVTTDARPEQVLELLRGWAGST